MTLRDAVADQECLLGPETTLGDEVREFLEVDAGKIRREHPDHVEDVVGIEEKGHGDESSSRGRGAAFGRRASNPRSARPPVWRIDAWYASPPDLRS